MKKVCIIIPDGTGIRNYLYSKLVSNLIDANCEIILLHSVSERAIEEILKIYNNISVYKIPKYKESLKEKFKRESICYARLCYNSTLTNNKSIFSSWKPNQKSLTKKAFYKLVKIFGNYISKKYKRILYFEDKYEMLVSEKTNDYKSILKEINPSVIFSTHQRAMNAVPIVMAAHQLEIKTVGAIFSWDNLPKARLTVRTNEYIVWSEYMKQEMNLFYPEIKNDNITITGTPQFEFYYEDDFIINKDDFFDSYNLDISKKIICFSGDDVRTSPFDANYLEDIASVIQTEKLDLQILLRRAPVDVSGRFDNVISKYPNIIKEVTPNWNFDKNDKENWQVIYPKFMDISLLVSTVFYSDTVVNLGSTMAHDFSIFNKSAIYLNYDPVPSDSWSVETIYKYQHFRSMGELSPVIWLNSKKDIKDVLLNALNNTNTDNKKWMNVISQNRQEASSNISNKLISCI